MISIFPIGKKSDLVSKFRIFCSNSLWVGVTFFSTSKFFLMGWSSSLARTVPSLARTVPSLARAVREACCAGGRCALTTTPLT